MAPVNTAIPYCGAAPSPESVWAQWNFDPLVLGGLLLLGALIVAAPATRLPNPRRTWAALALVALAVAFISPLCAMSSALFSARTVHHLLLVCVVAPLVAASLGRARRLGLTALLTATLIQAVVLWFWHAPGLYEAALSNHAVYALMEITLLAGASLFWIAIRSATAPAAAFALVLTMVQMGILGALLVFAASPFYAPHLLTTAAWGLAPLEDQQLSGLIMWVPAAGLYLVAALVLVGRWLGPDLVGERRAA